MLDKVYWGKNINLIQIDHFIKIHGCRICKCCKNRPLEIFHQKKNKLEPIKKTLKILILFCFYCRYNHLKILDNTFCLYYEIGKVKYKTDIFKQNISIRVIVAVLILGQNIHFYIRSQTQTFVLNFLRFLTPTLNTK